MRISALLTGFLFACLFTHAQQKTIEVTVTDTVYVKATDFLYTIKIEDARGEVYDIPDTGNTYKNYELRKVLANNYQQKMADSLTVLLTGKGFTVIPPPVESRFIQYYEQARFELYIPTHSLDSLQILFNVIKGNPMFTGYIYNRKAADESNDRKRLIAKALEKARTKASAIADAGKLKLGAIASVKEVEKEGTWLAYPPLSALVSAPGWHATIDKAMGSLTNVKDDSYAISTTLTVTFTAQ